MEEKKKSKKWIFIVLILILLLAIGGFIGFKLYEKSQEEETTETNWGDRYYEFLVEAEKSNNKNEYGFTSEAKNRKIRFLESDDKDNPNMIMNYEIDDEDRVSKYFDVEETIEYYTQEKESEVTLLYNIENNNSDWYLLSENDETEELTSINEIKNGNIEAEYTFNSEDEREEKFVEVEVEDEGIELDNLKEKAELKDAIKDAVEDFKDDDKIITEEVKIDVEEKVKEIKDNKNDKDKNNDYIQAGKYTLKYGKYVGENYLETDNAYSKYDIIIELKADGMYSETNILSDGRENTYNGRYSIVDGSEYGMSVKILKLNNDRGVFSINGNNEFSYLAGAGTTLKYQEETNSKTNNKLVIKTINGTSKIKETNEGIQFEDKLIKFGKYENKYIAEQIQEPSAYSILILKPNGEFHLKANVDDSGNMISPIDEDGTFYIEENLEEYPGTYSDFLNFETESGIKFSLYSAMSNQWTGYEYVGE